jgi:hypothetical protein
VSPVHRSSYPRSSCRAAATIGCSGAPASPHLRATCVALVLAGLVACGVAGAPNARFDDPALRLGGAAASLDDLGRTALTALTSGDRASLESVRLTELEHNDVVWPELPAAAPEVNFPVDFAWTNIESRNRAALSRLERVYRREKLVHQATECRGETKRFESFDVLTNCWVVFTREGVPDAYEARLFKDVLVRGGGYKIFRYYEGEPQRRGSSMLRGSHDRSFGEHGSKS